MQALLKNIAIAMVLIIPMVSQAKELHVDGAIGNDSISYNDNSASTPWRSLGRAVWGGTSISSSDASQAARAGDTVHVAAGTYNTNAVTNARYIPIYNPVNSGTSSAWITFRANGTVYLQSSNSSGTQPILGTQGRSYIVWDGFTVDEATVPTRRDTGPVVVWDSQYVTLQNLHVIGVIQNWSDNHNAIRIEEGDNIIVRNCRVHGFYESHGSCITTYRTGRLLLEHNDLSDAEDGIFIKGMNDGPVTIRYNRVYNTKNGIMLGSIGLSGLMSYVYQNVITDSALGGVIFVGYDNLTPAHVAVVNNTIHGASPSSDGGGILFRPGYDGYQNIIVKNNIVTNSAAGVTSWGTQLDAMSLSTNNYYGNTRDTWIGYQDYSLSDWQQTFGKDAGSSTTDPLYRGANDFRLADNSPLRTTGRDLIDLDQDGSTSDPIAMGAYISGEEIIGTTEMGSENQSSGPDNGSSNEGCFAGTLF